MRSRKPDVLHCTDLSITSVLAPNGSRPKLDDFSRLPGLSDGIWTSIAAAGAATAILKAIEAREVDVIVGTQLIAKGLDLPFVTTVGIINADVGLFFPDFRAGERTFQLITQMAGRAGRRTPHSRVIVQTYAPDHYVLRAASQHDVVSFYEHELWIPPRIPLSTVRAHDSIRCPPFDS